MKRGEVWTLAGGLYYAGKPRPALIVQDDRFDRTESITVCPFTTDATDAAVLRPLIDATEQNGLKTSCRLMIDKIVTVPKDKLGQRIGRLDARAIARVEQSIMIFFGLVD